MSWRNLFGLIKSFLHPPTSIIFSGATLLHAFPPCINKCRAGLSEETYNAGGRWQRGNTHISPTDFHLEKDISFQLSSKAWEHL